MLVEMNPQKKALINIEKENTIKILNNNNYDKNEIKDIKEYIILNLIDGDDDGIDTTKDTKENITNILNIKYFDIDTLKDIQKYITPIDI